MISVAPDHHPVTRVPVQTPAPPPASTTPCSDPHPQPHLDSPSPLQSQVSPSSSNSPSHSFSPINSEPTAPTENGPQPTAQTPNHTNTAQNPQQNIESSSPNIQTRAVETSEPEISPPSKSSTSQNLQNTATSDINEQQILNQHPMKTRAKNQILKPNKKFTLTVSRQQTNREPRTVAQALKDERWRRAMSTEYDAQIKYGTWDLVPPDPSQNMVSCRWIYTTKYLANGEEERPKARLVARGNTQKYGVDYGKTFSPVIKTTTIRLVLDIDVNKGWPLKQLDINNAFLQGELQEEVYMTQPPGFVDGDRPQHVCRLKKPIYGLKQAPRAWYMALKNHLLQIGFRNSLANTSLFIHIIGNHQTYILVYVDDIIVTGSDPRLVSSVLESLAHRFSIKDPFDLHYFLGVEVTRSSAGLHLMQRRYMLDLLARTNMLDSKTVYTPMQTTAKLKLNDGPPLSDASQYRSIVGSLQYLAFTRPDISFAVSRLSQFMHQPTECHWQAVKRVLRYLAGTTSHGVFMKAGSPLTLHAFTDADWAGDSDDYVSTNAYVIYLGSTPVSWSSKKKNGVARSSTEAEYRAVANTASKVRWIFSLLQELGITVPVSPVIFCDNVGATYLCANPVFHSRMKHIAIDYHFIRGLVQKGLVRVAHISTRDQLADALTKPLSRQQFVTATSKIGITRVPLS